MPVKEKEMTDDIKKADESSKDQAEGKLKESILDGLDLSAEIENQNEKTGMKEPLEKEEKPEEKEGEDEEVKESDEETSEQAEEETEAESEAVEDDLKPDEGEDEVVSKKKVQKRIDTLTAQIKQLQAENAKKQEAAPKEADPDTEKLNAMSNEQLKTVKKSVALAIVKETDDAKLDKLLDLQDKVHTAITTAPERFNQTQLAEYNKVADAIYQKAEIPVTEKSAKELKEIAQRIYSSQPELHTMKKGQAVALELAYEHYKVLLSKSAGKEKTDELKRANNTLKRKTALDSSGLKKSASKDALVKDLRSKAFRGGTSRDKENLIKNDPAFGLDSLIPDEFKQGE